MKYLILVLLLFDSASADQNTLTANVTVTENKSVINIDKPMVQLEKEADLSISYPSALTCRTLAREGITNGACTPTEKTPLCNVKSLPAGVAGIFEFSNPTQKSEPTCLVVLDPPSNTSQALWLPIVLVLSLLVTVVLALKRPELSTASSDLLQKQSEYSTRAENKIRDLARRVSYRSPSGKSDKPFGSITQTAPDPTQNRLNKLIEAIQGWSPHAGSPTPSEVQRVREGLMKLRNSAANDAETQIWNLSKSAAIQMVKRSDTHADPDQQNNLLQQHLDDFLDQAGLRTFAPIQRDRYDESKHEVDHDVQTGNPSDKDLICRMTHRGLKRKETGEIVLKAGVDKYFI